MSTSTLVTVASDKPIPTTFAGRPESRPVRGGGNMSVVVVDDLQALEDHVPAWEALAAESLELNPFYEAWMLMPAVRAFGAGENLRFVFVYSSDPARPEVPPLLEGVFPLARQSRYKGLGKQVPVRTLSLWKHKYCYLCTPLIRAEGARECVTAFLDWLAAAPGGPALMEFRFITGEGPFYQLLVDLFNERGVHSFVSDRFTRVVFQPAGNADEYLRAALARPHRKDLRKKERRLGETGRLEYLELGPDGDADAWIEEFIELEAKSWKGQEGTALASRPEDREFFTAIAREAFQRERLMMLAIHLDGRPIAHKCNLMAGPGSFAFKIAFDGEFSAFSPGVLLEIENIRRLHGRPELKWMDSCANRDNAMINRLWLDRLTIQNVVIGTGKMPGDLLVSSIPLLKWFNRRLRRRDLLRRAGDLTGC
ncbi:MAG TPA: GNAT family N-acetyltransferase [Blastocatellia bacterium]|nr:GNAT family N-acetyltransferase [Blastocatellia bacterium]